MSVGSMARADTPADREAQARFEEGLARVKATNFEGARMSFAQAYAVLHKPYILWNLALADEKSGHLIDALAHFKQFTTLAQSQGGDDRAAAERHIGELSAQVGHLDVSAPPGARVVVDGSLAGIAPLSEAVDVAPGSHHVQVRMALQAKEADADVAPGQLLHLTLTVDPPASPPPPPPSPVPSAAIATPGPIRDGASPRSSETSVPRVVTVVVMGAAAVVSGALGVYFGLQSQSDKTTADGFRASYSADYCAAMQNSPTCVRWNDSVQSQNRDAALSNGLYIAGGVLAVGTLATLLLWPRDSGSASVHVAPTVGVGGAGIGMTGRF